jgi:FkbH-like protein
MRLAEALKLLSEGVPEETDDFSVALTCSFTPLHLQTFLAAEIRRALGSTAARVSIGEFGDLVASLQRERVSSAGSVVIVPIEWPDFDPRLGLRRLGGWAAADLSDIVATARAQARRIADEVINVAESRRVICSLPTLPLPPLFFQRPIQSGVAELELRATAASLAVELAAHEGVRIVSAQRLERDSPLGNRHDPKSEIVNGFPYTLDHASAMGEIFATLAIDPSPKKGLITDLDGTLWHGIVGEDGPAAVSWNDEDGSHAHALYQQFLSSLASAGVLLAVASKNDPAIAQEVFSRDDIILKSTDVYPLEVHWNSKSISVGRILEAWNVAPDSVVFIDDSPIEVAEVQSVFPAIEGIVFPGRNYRDLLTFFDRLRNEFGKSTTNKVDAIRLDSLRNSEEFRQRHDAAVSSEEFLKSLGGKIIYTCRRGRNARALELINKTNQFNLNGERLSEMDLSKRLEREGSFLLTVEYSDKFGPLGEIAAIVGRVKGNAIVVDRWVMSCRAFARRIEYHCARFLFTHFSAVELALTFVATDRNAPFSEFLHRVSAETPIGGDLTVRRDAFLERSPEFIDYTEETRVAQ